MPGITQTDIGWLTGIIDGEGCLTCRAAYDKRDDRVRASLCASISNTSVGVIDRVKQLLSDLSVEYTIREVPSTSPTGRVLYDIRIQALKSILRLLLPILPHLASKKKEIGQAMIDYISGRMEEGMKTPFTNQNLDDVTRIRELCALHNTQRQARREDL